MDQVRLSPGGGQGMGAAGRDRLSVAAPPSSSTVSLREASSDAHRQIANRDQLSQNDPLARLFLSAPSCTKGKKAWSPRCSGRARNMISTRGFPGDTVDKTLPARAGDSGSIPDPGRRRELWSSSPVPLLGLRSAALGLKQETPPRSDAQGPQLEGRDTLVPQHSLFPGSVF